MMVESHQCPVGSYCCRQPLSSGSRRMMIAAMIAARVRTIPSQPALSVGRDEVLGVCVDEEVPAMLAPPKTNRGMSCDIGTSAESYSQNFTLAMSLCRRTCLTARCAGTAQVGVKGGAARRAIAAAKRTNFRRLVFHGRLGGPFVSNHTQKPATSTLDAKGSGCSELDGADR